MYSLFENRNKPLLDFLAIAPALALGLARAPAPALALALVAPYICHCLLSLLAVLLLLLLRLGPFLPISLWVPSLFFVSFCCIVAFWYWPPLPF